MDKQAYHYNKKKLPGKTPNSYLYYYPCERADNPNAWIEDKPYVVIEVSEREWEALFELDRLEYNNTHTYRRHTEEIKDDVYEDELPAKQRERIIDKDVPFSDYIEEDADKETAMNCLTDNERKVYNLVHERHATQKYAAEILGVTQGYISATLKRAEQKLEEFGSDNSPAGVAWRYWNTFVETGMMPDNVDVEIEFVIRKLVCDLLPFLHWYYSVGDLIRHITKFYLFDNDKMPKEIADYLATEPEEERQHYIDYYGDEPEIIGAVYIRLTKEMRRRESRGLKDSDKIYNTFITAADKIASRLKMTTEDFLIKRFYPFIAERRNKSIRQFYKRYTGKPYPKKKT